MGVNSVITTGEALTQRNQPDSNIQMSVSCNEFVVPSSTPTTTNKKKRIVLVSWDKCRSITMMGLVVSFVIWAAVFFSLTIE